MRRPQGAPARDDPQCGAGVLLAGDAAPLETAPGSASGGASRDPWPRARDQAFMGDSGETGDETCQRTGLEPRRRGAEGRQQKTPTAYADGGCVEKPCLTLLVSRRSGRGDSRGRSPDLRIILLANAFPAVVPPVAVSVGVRPRLQWRVREGLAPSSQHAPSRAATAIVKNLLSHHVSDVKGFVALIKSQSQCPHEPCCQLTG
jgi:hypothetical protein